ncbi:hypothetical protein [Polaromonas sp.]|uniref:hypothetical protein n=1 Tax=Polaromonas sp. TaxID=1869339 RepID=UPI0032676E95
MNSKTRPSKKPTPPSSGSVQPRPPIPAGVAPDAEQPNLVRIHDLTSFAVIFLPKALRALIGDEAYEWNLENIRNQELVLVIREPHDVVYIRIPVMAQELSTNAQASALPVKPPSRAKKKSKVAPATKSTAKRSVKPARKSSGKA